MWRWQHNAIQDPHQTPHAPKTAHTCLYYITSPLCCMPGMEPRAGCQQTYALPMYKSATLHHAALALPACTRFTCEYANTPASAMPVPAWAQQAVRAGLL
jgi:hypothetical protein